MPFQDFLVAAAACADARDWAAEKTFEEIYNTCERGDWLCWLFARTNPNDLQALTLVKGLQVNEIRHLMRDPRSIAAVVAAITFGGGGISIDKLNAAAADADADADAAYAAYAAADAAYAAYAAADAAYAAYADAAYAAYAADADAAYAAYAAADADADADAAYAADAYAAYAAYAAADAAYAADADAVRKQYLSRAADIFRENIPFEKINRVWETKAMSL